MLIYRNSRPSASPDRGRGRFGHTLTTQMRPEFFEAGRAGEGYRSGLTRQSNCDRFEDDEDSVKDKIPRHNERTRPG